MASVNQEGDVLVEGEFVGKLQGFVFVPDERATGVHGKALRAASDKALAGEIAARAEKFSRAPASEIALADQGRFIWDGHAVGRLTSGESPLAPRVELLASEQLNGPDREKAQERLESWIKVHIAKTLEPLIGLSTGEDLTGLARGVAFQLVENLGAINRERIADDVKALDQDARGQLRKKGVRFGAYSIFMPILLKPAAANLILTLWTLSRPMDEKDANPFDGLPPAPAPGLTSMTVPENAPADFYEAIGFRVSGPRAVRRDMLERLADVIRPVISERRYKGGFVIDPDMMSLMGCSAEEMAGILKGLGYKVGTEKFTLEEIAEAERLTAAAKAPKKIAATAPHKVDTPQQAQPEQSSSEAVSEASAETSVETPAPAVPETPEPAPTTAAAPEPTQEPIAEEQGAPTDAETVEELATPAAAISDAVTETPEIAEAPQPEAEAPIDTDLEIWRPQRRHQGGRPHRNRGKNQQNAGGDKQAQSKQRNGKPGNRSGNHKGKGPRRDQGANRPHHKPKPKDKPIDPDSPFAALMALKNPPPKD